MKNNQKLDNWLVTYVAGICFLAAILHLVGNVISVIANPSDKVFGAFFGLLLIIFWSHCGMGIIKRRKKERNLTFVASALTIFLAVRAIYTEPFFSAIAPTSQGNTLKLWLLWLELLVSLSVIFVLSMQRVNKQFEE